MIKQPIAPLIILPSGDAFDPKETESIFQSGKDTNILVVMLRSGRCFLETFPSPRDAEDYKDELITKVNRYRTQFIYEAEEKE